MQHYTSSNNTELAEISLIHVNSTSSSDLGSNTMGLIAGGTVVPLALSVEQNIYDTWRVSTAHSGARPVGAAHQHK